MKKMNNGKPRLHDGAVKALPLALMLAMGAVHAQDADSMFSYSGFGTVGATHSSSKKGDYVSTLYQPSGPGVSRSWDINTDTKLGAQVSARISDQLTAVVQLVSAARSDNTFEPRFEWANLQYAFTPDFKVRVGRTALATFLASDTRLVGYANPWIRPPVEIYSDTPMTNLDGVDLTYRSRFGGVINTLQLFTGRTDIKTIDGAGQELPTNKIRRARGLANSVEFGAWTVRASYMQSTVTFDLGGGTILDVAQRSVATGASYDPGTWFVQGEYTSVKLPGITPTVKGAYVMGGYRLGNFTPYAIHARSWSTNVDVGLTTYDQRTDTLGVRWDAMKNIAVKLQFDQIRPVTGSAGYFIRARPGLDSSNFRLLGLAVDFVF
ncbi:hypothetical protein [Janthinobacterium sp. PC23-8]|uniref:hypothetical protein n=1 Tax=Janthinobacterium sp. PC23-8 TaxID=2012679 RepID=UPI000B95FEF3|nr:hypothetical protein [Janthinobacterium sp. PC23-8]OYO28895.1 hypothetical protein CD932_17300 [Janthinobacterium sp. PC23-8]